MVIFSNVFLPTVAFILQMASLSGVLYERTKRFSSNTPALIAWLLLSISGGANNAIAASSELVNITSFIICDEPSSLDVPPDFNGEQCKTITSQELNVGHQLIWVKALLQLDDEFKHNKLPLGLFISAKAASEVYLNGTLLGRNGQPADNTANEQPGLMDTVFHIPEHLLKADHNELVVKMSAFHDYLNLGNTLQHVIISQYSAPQDIVLRNYLPSLLPLGVLLVGFFYSAALAFSRPNPKQDILLPLASFLIIAQLLTEISRGVVFYNYPLHDIRTTLILMFGMLSGGCLLTYIANYFLSHKKDVVLAISFLVTILAIFSYDTMEEKSVVAIQLPAIFSLLIATYASFHRKRSAINHAIALLMFVVVTILKPNQFLDVYFYYFVAALLLFFLFQQVLAFRQEQHLRRIEQSKAERLQHALDDYREQQQPSKLQITHAGKVEWLSSEHICVCKGARDYVEIITVDKRSILHAGSLTALEECLPSMFLRVHRSYIVNTRYIQSLNSEPSGTGRLILTTEDEIPVSRRIMPKVRQTLTK